MKRQVCELVAMIAVSFIGDAYAQGTRWEPTTGMNAEGGLGWFASGTGGRVFAAGAMDFFRSTDDGATWVLRNVEEMPTNVNCLAVTPSGHVMAAGYKHVLRSTDEGATWTLADSGLTLDDPYGSNLVVSPRGCLLFTNQVTGNCWTSLNEGRLWEKVELPRKMQSFIRVSATAHGYFFANIDGVVYRCREDSVQRGGWVRLDSSAYAPYNFRSGSWGEVYGITGAGVVSSADNGAHWGMIYLQDYVSILEVGPAGDVFAGGWWHNMFGGNYAFLHRSTNYGATWQSILPSGISKSLPINQLAATAGGSLLLVSSAGVHRSTNAGETWMRPELPLVSVSSLALNPVGSLFAGTWIGVMISKDGGRSWAPVNPGVKSPDHSHVAIGSDGYIYAFSSNRRIVRSTDDGSTWSWADGGVQDRTVSALAVSPQGYVYAGIAGDSGGVFRSRDHGESWAKVFALSTSSQQFTSIVFGVSGTMFGATNMGIYRSFDGGDTWTKVSTLNVGRLIADRDGVLYASTIPKGIYRSTNQGGNWLTVGEGLPMEDNHLTVLCADSAGNVLAGVEPRGVFRLGKGASAWTLLGTDLPRRSVNALIALPDGVVLAAVGFNGVYRLSESATAVKPDSDVLPQGFVLNQNYPNPFNPATVIKYTVGGTGDQGLGASDVRLVVYDMLGREVAVLVNESKAAGSYTVPWDASGMASGVYFYRLSVVPSARRDLLPASWGPRGQAGVPNDGRDGTAGTYVASRRMVLVR